MTRPAVIFVHIGKTAGTTLSAIARRHYPSDAVFTVDSGAATSPAEQLRGLAPERLSRLSLVLGHGQYGLHEQLPGPSTYISLLRDPVQRAVSGFRHVARTPTHRLHTLAVESRMTLLEYATGGVTEESDNWQTRCVAGGPQPPIGECGPELLERAVENVERHFAVLGLAERFDETLVLLRRKLGWRRVYYVALNTASDDDRVQPTPAERERILESNPLDHALYEHVTARLERELSEIPDLDRELRRLRGSCSIYGQVRRRRAQVAALAGRVRGEGVAAPAR
jgi:hypothetical protein